EGLGVHEGARAAWYALALFLVVVAARFAWSYPATFLPRLLSARVRAREENPTWRQPFVIAWAGMRGVVSLAIAFSIPLTGHGGAPFPE
ncbi:cation:proton antiporter, partial [Streptomyces sp. TRM76130]|nr:cation:proton antiporter [Streptomyces sp. TRM76130]